MSNFRIEDKHNVHMNGRKTFFRLFQYEEDEFGRGQYVHVGNFAVPGWDAPDGRCIDYFIGHYIDCCEAV